MMIPFVMSNFSMTISNKALLKRANYFKLIRQFFADKKVLEVETPLSYPYPVSDPYIDAFSIQTKSGQQYLQTSPEYAMKRLLANGSGSIYQICKAFRDDPKAQFHSHEFTMLEWYRVGLDDQALREEIIQMIRLLKPEIMIHQFSYKEVFTKVLQLNPHQADALSLRARVKEEIGEIHGLAKPSHIECLDLLFSHCIEPWLRQFELVFVYDYPKIQAALARVADNLDGEIVAKRFELFYQGIELANGYDELTDSKEQRKRFDNDLLIRQQIGKPEVPVDEGLLSCLDKMPACAGVALGLDRLIMCLEGYQHIEETLYCPS